MEVDFNSRRDRDWFAGSHAWPEPPARHCFHSLFVEAQPERSRDTDVDRASRRVHIHDKYDCAVVFRAARLLGEFRVDLVDHLGSRKGAVHDGRSVAARTPGTGAVSGTLSVADASVITVAHAAASA